MSRARVYARNLLANWVGYFANVVVAFCLAPFVVSSLGHAAYGVWTVLTALTGYLGLVEMGTQAGLGRFVNFHLGRGDVEKANQTLNAALAFFVAVGGALLVVALGLTWSFEYLFTKVPPELVTGAKPALLLVAVNLWLSFLAAAFGQVLTAHERFDLQNAVTLAVLAIRTVGTVWVLQAGRGLLALAAVQVASSVMGVGLSFLLARRAFPGMRLGWSHLRRDRLRELLGFGVWAFVAQIAMRLMYMTDEIVILVLLGPAPVTFYALALMLVKYGRDIIDSMAGVLGPQTIKASSTENYSELRHILAWGSKVIMFLAIPLFVGMVFLGREFFILWMGDEFALSGRVLILLALPQLFVMGVRPCVNIVNGLGRVRFGALLTLLQGVANLALSLAFVMWLGLGLYGVALGTLVPAVIFNCLAGAIVLRWIRYPGRDFLRHAVLRWLLAAAIASAASWSASLLPTTLGWLGFALKVLGVTLVALPLGWLVIFTRQERHLLISRLLHRHQPADTAPADTDA